MVLEFDVPLEVAQAAREQAKELSFSDAAKVRCVLPAVVGSGIHDTCSCPDCHTFA